MKWNTMYSFDHTQYRGELNYKATLTVPNQAMSMREIMARFVNGQPIVQSQREEVYDGEEYYPDPSKMDLAEVEQLKEQYAEELKEIKARNKKTKEEANKKPIEEQKVLEKIPTEDPQREKESDGQPS